MNSSDKKPRPVAVGSTGGSADRGRRAPSPKLPRCCWLNDDQRMCRHEATGRKIVFADPQGMSGNEWFWVPVCRRHGAR